jgi:hypothetical protein
MRTTALPVRVRRLIVLLTITDGAPSASAAQAPVGSVDVPSQAAPPIAGINLPRDGSFVIAAGGGGCERISVSFAPSRHDTCRGLSVGASSQPAPGSTRHAMRWGIAIGIGAGLAIAGYSAARYGENEGGRFCGACFIRWSAIAVPVGAGIGAAVGYAIDRARR